MCEKFCPLYLKATTAGQISYLFSLKNFRPCRDLNLVPSWYATNWTILAWIKRQTINASTIQYNKIKYIFPMVLLLHVEKYDVYFWTSTSNVLIFHTFSYHFSPDNCKLGEWVLDIRNQGLRDKFNQPLLIQRFFNLFILSNNQQS